MNTKIKAAISREEELLKNYHKLSELNKKILHIKALIYKFPGREKLLEIIKSINLRDSKGKKFNFSTLSISLDYLIKAGLILEGSYDCPPDIIPTISQLAAKADSKDDLIAKIKKTNFIKDSLTFEQDHEKDDILRLVYLSVYQQNDDFFNKIPFVMPASRYIDVISKSLKVLFTAIDFKWLATLSPTIQLHFCLANICPHYMGEELPKNSLMPWVNIFNALPLTIIQPYTTYLAALTHLFLGNKKITNEICKTKDLDPKEYHLLQGLLCGIDNKPKESLEEYTNALKIICKKNKKRNWFLADLNATFMLIAAMENGENLDDISKGVLNLIKNSRTYYNRFWLLIDVLLSKTQGKIHESSRDIHVNRINHNDIIYTASYNNTIFSLLLEGWLYSICNDEAIKLFKIENCIKKIRNMATFYSESHPLLAHLFLEILAHSGTKKYTKLLSASAFAPLNFRNRIPVKEEWELALDKLTVTIAPEKYIPEYNDKRLAWLFDPENLRIDVVEQKLQKNGNWSNGRAISKQKLFRETDSFSYLDDYDKEALRSVENYNTDIWDYYTGSYYFDMGHLLTILIGCKRVFHMYNRDVPIELASGTLTLNIDEHGDDQYILRISHYPNKYSISIEQETQNRYRIIKFSEKDNTLAEIIPSTGLIIPKSAKSRILSLVENDTSNIKIQANIDGVNIPKIEADSTMCVHLFPMSEKLRVEVGVRPFGKVGPFYKASQGPERLIEPLDTENGKINHQTIRNFSKEKEYLQELLNNCPAVQLDENTSFEAENLEQCLEVVEQLEACSPPLKLEWPQGKTLHIKQKLSAQKLFLEIRDTGGNWFEYDGEVALDNNEVIKMENLLDLLENSSGRFLHIGNGEYLALTESFKKRLEELQAISEKNKIFNLGTSTLEALSQEAGQLKIDRKWTEHIENIKKMAKYQPTLPKTLQAKLRDYQEIGFTYLARLANWGIGVCLADDMGLGKTVQTIALLLDQAHKGPALIIAPTTVCFNWFDEFTKFAPSLQVYTLNNTDIDRQSCIANLKKNEVLICSYGLLVQSIEWLEDKQWHTVVLDEAQAIKNHQTQRWKCIAKLKSHCRIALTGTPIENHLGELWSIFRFLNPGLLGSLKSFQDRFANPIEKYKSRSTLRALQQLVSPYILRRLKSEVLKELPPKTEQTITIEPSTEEMAFYEALRRKSLKKISGIAVKNDKNKRFSILAEIGKLRQACCDATLVDSEISIKNSKLELFVETIKRLIENKNKVLVFSQYVRYLSIIQTTLENNNISYQYIDGSVTAKQRKQRVEDFQSGKGDIFLLSLKAGGTGINLTAADYVIHLDPWWNPAVEQQASDRAHRLGQDRPVTIYRFIVKNTIEEKIVKMHKEKRNLATDLLNNSEMSGKLSEEDLIALM